MRRGRVEVRFNANGSPDEVFLYDNSGAVALHLEQMDDGAWWMRLEDPCGVTLDVNFASPAPIAASCEWDV